jgi:hypothetical protein
MNRRVRRALASGKRKIEQRHANAVRENDGGPVLAGSNVRYEVAEKTRAIVEGGIGAIHRMVRKLKLPERIDAELKPRRALSTSRPRTRARSCA